ncbi:hypothetical protein 8F11_46 [uncultured Caudovirales phage]|uniref:Uncharacterized protein n=1 Tax=uncultured Caudovirales phage TaxID=2100421 RepID=A0A2H4J7M7_9CAUD|nr:hypothetical protein 8F11_46 [uncultured Caudovirales phage]
MNDYHHEIEELRHQLHRFMPAEYWRHDITIKDGLAYVTTTYLKPIEYIYIDLEVK